MTAARRSDRNRDGTSYRRDQFTWTEFGALFAFGYLNAVLGPSLPYLRAAEHISYLVAVLHQVAFAVGGGIAGTLSARGRIPLRRWTVISVGLAGAALAGLIVGYGDSAPVTVAGALLLGLLSTLALIRLWAALADAHGPGARSRCQRARSRSAWPGLRRR